MQFIPISESVVPQINSRGAKAHYYIQRERERQQEIKYTHTSEEHTRTDLTHTLIDHTHTHQEHTRTDHTYRSRTHSRRK